jgi:hypothetical protein
MEKILGTLIYRCCVVNVKDILIFGESIEILLSNLDAGLERISSDSWSINLGKLNFLADEIDFLGHSIGMKGMMATLKDISVIENYKKPTSKKEM